MFLPVETRAEIVPTVHDGRVRRVHFGSTIGMNQYHLIGEYRVVDQQKDRRGDPMTYMVSVLPGSGRVMEVFDGSRPVRPSVHFRTLGVLAPSVAWIPSSNV